MSIIPRFRSPVGSNSLGQRPRLSYRMYSLQPKSIDFDSVWFQQPKRSISTTNQIPTSSENFKPLSQVVQEVLANGTISREDYFEHFNTIFFLCTATPEAHARRLYVEVRSTIRQHVLTLSDELIHLNGTHLLRRYRQLWSIYTKAADTLNKIFGHLNSQYVQMSQEHLSDLPATALYDVTQANADEPLKEIGCLALDIWLSENLKKLKGRLVEAILDSVARDRAFESVLASAAENVQENSGANSFALASPGSSKPSSFFEERTLARAVIESFVECHTLPPSYIMPNIELHTLLTLETRRQNFYETVVEAAYLSQLDKYYEEKARTHVPKLSPSAYVSAVLAWQKWEDERARAYLRESSITKVLDILQTRCVSEHLDFVLRDSPQIVSEMMQSELMNLYELLHSMSPTKSVGIERLVSIQLAFIEQETSKAIANVTNQLVGRASSAATETLAIEFVEALIAKQKFFKELITRVYISDQRFFTALDRAFCRVVNASHFALSAKAAAEAAGAGSSAAAKTLGLAISPDLLARYCDSVLRCRKGTNSIGKHLTPSDTDNGSNDTSPNASGLRGAAYESIPSANNLAVNEDSNASSAGTAVAIASAIANAASAIYTPGGSDLEKLKDALCIFRYIDDKDYFLKVYSKFFARRLIYHQSSSSDDEEFMINNLKQTCGFQYTIQLQGMYKDIYHVCEELNKKFSKHLSDKNIKLPISTKWLTLQSNSWPFNASTTIKCAIPEPLEMPFKMFEEFYLSTARHRKLTWLHSYSLGEVRLHYLQRPYTVTLTTPQLCTLLLYDGPLGSSGSATWHAGADSHTVAEIEKFTLMQGSDLAHTLQALLDCKLLQLGSTTGGGAVAVAVGGARSPETSSISSSGALTGTSSTSSITSNMALGIVTDVEMSDRSPGNASPNPAAIRNSFPKDAVVELNMNFYSRRLHFRTANAAPKEQESSDITARAVDDDRKFTVQAAIMRILKVHKTLRHNDLMSELTTACHPRFVPSVGLVKKCLEILIERQYIERSQSNQDEYIYIS